MRMMINAMPISRLKTLHQEVVKEVTEATEMEEMEALEVTEGMELGATEVHVMKLGRDLDLDPCLKKNTASRNVVESRCAKMLEERINVSAR